MYPQDYLLFNKTDSGLFLQWCARKKTDRKTHWCGCGRPLYQSDTHYVNDTLGDITNQTAVAAEMAAQVAAFSESMQQLQTKVTTMGGFFWQLMGPAPGNNVFSAMPFYSLSENRVSAKTGSGQHSLGNVGKKTRLHCREFGLGLAASGRPRQLRSQAERITVRGQPFIPKTIILPRQARNKHSRLFLGKAEKNTCVSFLPAGAWPTCASSAYQALRLGIACSFTTWGASVRTFFGGFPMSVPSLSWQKDRF